MTADQINAAFELLGGAVLIVNIRTLLKHKQVRGFNPMLYAFFSLWGIWNLVYYPHLHQWFSFVACILLAGANVLYFGLSLYYTLQERKSNVK